MRIGLFASNAALSEYFVTALGMADHTVTLYPARQDLFSEPVVAASLRRRAPDDMLLLELILDNSGTQISTLLALIQAQSPSVSSAILRVKRSSGFDRNIAPGSALAHTTLTPREC
jgi:hypothetical protein